jgi:hypothetical protein
MPENRSLQKESCSAVSLWHLSEAQNNALRCQSKPVARAILSFKSLKENGGPGSLIVYLQPVISQKT